MEKEITSRLKQIPPKTTIGTIRNKSTNPIKYFFEGNIPQDNREILAEALQVDYSKILRLLPQEQQFIMEAGGDGRFLAVITILSWTILNHRLVTPYFMKNQ